MTSVRYDIYLNSAMLGVVHAADCVVEEDHGVASRVGFRYRPDYLSHPQAFALDPVQLPLSGEERLLNCRGGIPGFLDDYLPDDWGRKVLTKLAFYRDNQQFNANSVIDSLALIGKSRIGALCIVPHGQSPFFDTGSRLEELAKAEQAAQQIDDMEFSSVDLDEMSLLYLANSGTGVGGARPKALVHEDNQAYIAKFNRLHRDDFNNARVELACLRMADAAGIDVASGRIQPGINEREALLLERFDLDTAGHRLHLITMNALLKEPATQRDHGHVFRYDNIHELLTRYSVDIEHDLRQLLLRMLFNRAINNVDDHERNFSLINRGDGYRLAPAYDLVPVLVTGQYHAAGFGYDPSPPTPSEIIHLGKVFGLPHTIIAECAEQVQHAVSQWHVYAEDTGVSEAEYEKIERYFHR